MRAGAKKKTRKPPGGRALESAAVERNTARLFMHGRSQAVRLPLEFRMPGDRVRIRRVKDGVLLQPLAADLDTIFEEVDRLRAGEIFMPEGREQPDMPEDEDLFD